ncbi:MAG TPA: hypothetical protein EYP98_18890, partial [Planctomycetes bacterium]|nr:hypothetical protein [Planctomycetota bacterium]
MDKGRIQQFDTPQTLYERPKNRFVAEFVGAPPMALIDGTALAYRSFFAFQGTGRSPLTTGDGHPTAATYGFCMTLRALIEREQPDAMAIAFDGPRSDLLRTKIYPEYKSTRTKMPDEMAMQLDDIREAVDGFGLQVVS